MRSDTYMKNLIIVSKSRNGGAGRAAFRWSQALNDIGIANVFYDESTGVTEIGNIQSRVYKIVKFINRICLVVTRLSGHTPFGPFTFDLIPTFHERKLSSLSRRNESILNLHWINNGFLSRKWMSRIQSTYPTIWTMHDTWLLNGVVHYEIDSEKLKLRQTWLYGYWARWDSRSKMKIILGASGFISPTNWIAKLLVNQGVDPSKIRVIPNMIPLEVFYPIPDRRDCKEFFGLSNSRIVVGFVSGSDLSDRRKGLDIFIDAYRMLTKQEKDSIQIVILGPSKDWSQISEDFDCKTLVQISNDLTMNKFYNSLDLLVVPSRADNLPQTATEAQSSGCPVIISNVGGCPETISENQSGRLFEPTPLSLSSILRKTIHDPEWLLAARKKSFEYSRLAWNPEALAKRYKVAILELSDNFCSNCN